jgi:hypothetical protein
VQFGKANDTFHEPGLSSNAGWIVVYVNFNTRRPKDRIQSAYKPVDDPKTRKIAAVFDQTVIVGCEDVQAFARRGAARKTQQE